MKKYTLLILAFAISAFANDRELTFSVQAMNMDYREYSGGAIIDSEKAHSLPGFGLQYKEKINDTSDGMRSFVDIDFSQYYGDTTYVGFYLNSGGQYGDVTATTKNTISDGSIGYTEDKMYDNYLLFMRIGVGYRFWERALADGHTEQYKWPYGSVKMGVSADLSTQDNLSIAAEYHHAISPKMDSNIYGTFDLGRTNGFSVSVPWEHTLTSSWAFKLTYMYQTWNIGKSASNAGFYEPDSESKFHTINAALVYRY